ncbi:MAG: MFS transporter [Gaiellaceae bacterium]
MARPRTSRIVAPLVERLSHRDGAGPLRLQLPGEDTPLREIRPLLLVLGLPTFGLAFAISVITTYGPVVLIRLAHSPTAVGALIGGEGAFALAIPLVAGAVSDRLPDSRLGRRAPFVLLGIPFALGGLVLLPVSETVGVAGAAVLAFFVGYYLYYPPYRALYPDLLPRALYAGAQAGQAIARGAGLGIALLAGGLLLGVSRLLPFLIAAGVLALTTTALYPVLRLQRRDPKEPPEQSGGLRDLVLRNGRMRTFAAVNGLWELSFAGMKSFIILYVVRGLGRSPAIGSAVIAVVAVAYVVGAPLASWLASRYGLVRVLRVASLVYGAGLVAGTAAHTLTPLLVGLPVVALAGATVLTLPQALAFTLAPDGSEGAAAGLQDFSRGVGVVLGPVAVGAAVGASHQLFASTHGYAAMWPVVGLPVLLAALLLRRLDG